MKPSSDLSFNLGNPKCSMVDTTASIFIRTGRSFQSFGLVLFSFVADVVSIVIATQQQQVGRLGFGILAVFLSACSIAQILGITWRISTIKRNVWPLMVGIVFGSGILAFCSRIWSGNDWWQWILVSLLIPVASLVFVSWMYGRAEREWERPFTFDFLSHWFGFAALGFAADVIAIVGAITSPDFRYIFAAIGLVLTLIVIALLLFITQRESQASNQSGPLITGLFTSGGLAVAYLYIWIDKELWEALTANMLIVSLAIILGLLRCSLNQPGVPTPGANISPVLKHPKRKSPPRRQNSIGVGTSEAPENPQSGIDIDPNFRRYRPDGGDPGASFGMGNPKNPPPNLPGSPSLDKFVVSEVESQSNIKDQSQSAIRGMERIEASRTPKVDAVDLGEKRQGELSETHFKKLVFTEQAQKSSTAPFSEAFKREVERPQPGSLVQSVLYPSSGETSELPLNKQNSLFPERLQKRTDLRGETVLDVSQIKGLLSHQEPNTIQRVVNIVPLLLLKKRGLLEDAHSGSGGIGERTGEPQLRNVPFDPPTVTLAGKQAVTTNPDKGESVIEPKDGTQITRINPPPKFIASLPGDEGPTLDVGPKRLSEDLPLRIENPGVQVQVTPPQAQREATDILSVAWKYLERLTKQATHLEHRSKGDGGVDHRQVVETRQGGKVPTINYLPEPSTIPADINGGDSSAFNESSGNLDTSLGTQSNVIGAVFPSVKPTNIELLKPVSDGQLDKATRLLSEPRSIKQDGNS